MEEHGRADQVFMLSALAAGIGFGIVFFTYPDVKQFAVYLTLVAGAIALVVNKLFR